MERTGPRIGTSVLTGCVVLASCVGLIGDPGLAPQGGPGTPTPVDGGGVGPGRDGGGGGGGGGDGGTPTACTAVNTAPTPIRRLTRLEYNNTVRDLLGDTSAPASSFPPDETAGGFTNNAASQTVSVLLAEGYMDAAEQLAASAVERLGALLPCEPASGEEACARRFVEQFGRRAYRRPLAPAEVTSLMDLYRGSRSGGRFADGIQTVIQALLVSPHFLFRPEFGEAPAGGAGGNAVPLTQFELATRLSYFLWSSAPDETLLDAAAAGQLATREQVATQARRLLADSRAHEAINEFYAQWLGLEELEGLTKDPAVYPEFDDELRHAMAQETVAFVDHVLWQGDARLETLLTAPMTFVNGPLAALYGLEGVTGTELRRVDLPPTQRAGILTQPGLLAMHAKPNQSSPVHRGRFVRERLLCQTLPDPPANLQVVAPDPAPGVPTRQRFAEHSSNPACAGCHNLMDPVGFGFENFDGVGRWRDRDQGMAVDASGELRATRDIDGTFRGPVELAQRLARSEDVRECVTRQWFRFAQGRGETMADACSMHTLNEAFRASGYNLRELMVAITQTDAFLYRRADAQEGSR